MSQEHNQCLVTDTSAAGSSSLLPVRDVRDELQRSPARGAHTTLLLHPHGGLPSSARRSPPTLYLLRRAGPVNRGAVWGWIQLDGRWLLLGHFEPGKGAPNSEGKAAPLASSLCAVPRPPRGTNSEPGAWGLLWGGRDTHRAVSSAPRGRWRSHGTPALLTQGSARRAGNRRGTPPAQFGSRGFPPSLPQSTRLSGSSGTAERAPEPCSNHNPGKYCRCRRRAPNRSAQPSQGGTGGRGRGEKRESLAPPIRAAACSHTHSAPPHCLFDSQ